MTRLMQAVLRRIYGKIAMAVALVLILAMATFFYIAQSTGRRLLNDLGHTKAEAIVEIGKLDVARLMLKKKNHVIQAELNSIMQSGHAVEAFVLRSNGSVMYDRDGEHRDEHLPIKDFRPFAPNEPARFWLTEEQGKYYEVMISPFENAPACRSCHPPKQSTIGFFAVKIPLDDMRASAASHRLGNTVMATLIFIGVGVALFTAIVFLVIRPINRLRRHISRVERQIPELQKGTMIEIDEHGLTKTGDEIADLAGSFQALVGRLNKAYREILDLHALQMQKADQLATTGEMAASIAHEIRNPVAGVRAALQVFDHQLPAGDHRRGVIAEMLVQLDRINAAVNDLLTYSRPSPPEFELIPLQEVIEKTAALIEPQQRAGSILIDRRLAHDDEMIMADRKMLQQLFWNIMLNGLQAMDGKGTLLIRTQRENGHVRVDIADTGPGIPEEQLQHIFKPFFTTKHKGTGLGLAICRTIVEQHGGAVEVASTQGSGTRFTIRFPRWKEGVET